MTVPVITQTHVRVPRPAGLGYGPEVVQLVTVVAAGFIVIKKSAADRFCGTKCHQPPEPRVASCRGRVLNPPKGRPFIDVVDRTSFQLPVHPMVLADMAKLRQPISRCTNVQWLMPRRPSSCGNLPTDFQQGLPPRRTRRAKKTRGSAAVAG